MSMRESSETMLPFHHARGDGAIVFDARALPQTPAPEWFDAAHWGADAQPVGSGGRGAAWFIDEASGAMVLRRYLRGGLMAKLSHDSFVWRGQDAVRSFAEFRLLQTLHAQGLPVPMPLAAAYWRSGRRYRAAILLQRIVGVHSFGHRVLDDAASAPWRECGALIARFHRAGLDHPDLNAHNLLFDAGNAGWMIDFDKGRIRGDAASGWRQANLSRLRRSLDKITGGGQARAIETGFAHLLHAYDQAMAGGST